MFLEEGREDTVGGGKDFGGRRKGAEAGEGGPGSKSRDSPHESGDCEQRSVATVLTPKLPLRLPGRRLKIPEALRPSGRPMASRLTSLSLHVLGPLEENHAQAWALMESNLWQGLRLGIQDPQE